MIKILRRRPYNYKGVRKNNLYILNGSTIIMHQYMYGMLNFNVSMMYMYVMLNFKKL